MWVYPRLCRQCVSNPLVWLLGKLYFIHAGHVITGMNVMISLVFDQDVVQIHAFCWHNFRTHHGHVAEVISAWPVM